MKRYYLLIYVLFIPGMVSAQTMDQVGWIAKFGLAGGVTPIWFSPNIDELNKQVVEFGLEKFSESGIITYGGGGYAYIMFIDNLRIGGIGFAGSSSSSRNINGYNRQVDYSIGGGGITVEYTIPSIKNIAVSIGALIGTGSLEIDIYQHQGSAIWDDLWDGFSSPSENINRKISNNYYIFAPTLNFDIPLNRFIALRIGGGYQLTFSNNWELDNEQSLQGIPASLKADSFFLQTGLFIGFFAF